MGGTALKAARHARGWTKPDLMQEMRAVSARVGERLPVDTSMRVSVARWENGHRQPGEFYRWLFCQVYSATPGQLGFPPFELLPEVAPGHAVLTALLYTAPLTTTELATVPPARARMYAACALADPRTPDPADLAAGLD
ncbi:MAG: hypothetical protein ACRDRH_29105, partial [Pseudonocardia sp.]